MAITIVGQWPGVAEDQDEEIIASPTTGRMLIAPIVTCVIDGSAPTLAMGDVSRNGWTLLADPIQWASSAHAAAQLQVEIWACPSAQYAGWPLHYIYASAMQITAPDVGSMCVNVIEVSGMTGQLTVDSVTLTSATASTTLALTAPAPTGGANVLQIAAAVTNLAYASYTTTGTGWTQLSNVTATTPAVGLLHAWREATTGGTCTFTLGSAQSWAGVVVALKTAGVVPAQPNAAWPPTSFQVGLGYDLSTPLSRVRWTDQTTRYQSLGGDRGIQAELGTATPGTAALSIRNDDGAYTPRPVALAASATAVGTTTTIKVADASAANIHVTDYFRLKTSGGVLKQLDTFQVTGLSPVAGTTTITFKRADGTAGGALAATASGDVYAGIAIDLYIPWRLVKVVAGVPYTVASGWLRDLPVSFTDAHWSDVTAAGADALEVLSVAGNPSALRGEIMRRSPYAYWPLDDSTGAGYAANASGVSNASLTQTASKYGVGVDTAADFGASTQDRPGGAAGTAKDSLLGDPGTGWAQDGQTSAEMATKGYALVGSDPGMPSIAGGVTIVGATQISSPQVNLIIAATADPTLFILRNTDPAAGVGQGSVIKVSMTRDGFVSPIVTRWDKTTHATTSTTASATAGFASAWVSWALTFNQTSWAMYMGGDLAGSGTCNLVSAFSGIDVGGEADAFFHGRTFPGAHAHIAIYGRKLTPGEIGRLASSTVFGLFGFLSTETASSRIQKKLAYAAWKNTRILTPGVANVSAEAAPSGSVADLASDVAGQEDSLVFADAANQFQYRNRITAYQQVSRATLGEDTASGEIPYQPGQVFDFNPVYLYNDVEVENTQAGGYSQLTTSTFVAVDDTSAARYGARTLTLTSRYSSAFNAWNVAWWLLSQYAYPQLRVGTVVVSAAATADVARWAFVCGVEVGDLVTVKRRPIGQPAITVRCRVLRVEPNFDRQADPVVAQVRLTLGTAPPQVPLSNDPVYGVVGGTVLGA
jgi:hypothetical protein